MAQNDSVDKMVAGAKTALANADAFTKSAEGDPTSHFHAKQTPSHIEGVKAAPAHEHSDASYGLASELKAKTDNVNQVAQ